MHVCMYVRMHVPVCMQATASGPLKSKLWPLITPHLSLCALDFVMYSCQVRAACERLYVFMYVYVCMHVDVCVCVCVFMCVCVFVYVCVCCTCMH